MGQVRSGNRNMSSTASTDSRISVPFLPCVAAGNSCTRSHDEPAPADTQAAATGLLERALRIGQEKEDAEWLHNSAVKGQMKRMDPSFSEKALGFKSFSDFLRSRGDLVDVDETSATRMVRLHTDSACGR